MTSHTNRPLSPHLQVYRWQLTMLTSIVHRMSGVVLSIGAVLVAAWLIAAAMGEEAYAVVNGHLGAWYGRLVLLGFSFALFYHLCNGVRHMIWDTGAAMSKDAARISGYVMLVTTVVLTATAWGLALL